MEDNDNSEGPSQWHKYPDSPEVLGLKDFCCYIYQQLTLGQKTFPSLNSEFTSFQSCQRSHYFCFWRQDGHKVAIELLFWESWMCLCLCQGHVEVAACVE